jgi:LysR family transcriptional regulator, hydrogen peroxide-inducible genes activator
MTNMTLTQLEYILAVDKHRHFGKAAESCFVTQPTLSMQIQKLEEQLQVMIFDRSKNPIEPTMEGLVVINQAKVIIQEQKKLLSIIEEAKHEVAGDFKIAVIPTLSPFIVPLFLHDFMHHYPKVNLQITESKTEDIIELLKADEIDAGLLVTPLHDKTIVEKNLFYEPFYLFTSLQHPLSKKQRIKEEDLDINEIWLLNKGNCFRDQVLNICHKRLDNDLRNPINFESGNFETLKNLVLQGHGYTLLPHLAVSQLSTQQKKMIRPFVRPIPTREVSLVHSKHCVKHKILNALEEEILASIPDELRQFKSRDQQVIEIS